MIRARFIRIHGRISSTEAPVVPNTLASTAPKARNTVFSQGVAPLRTLRWMPPLTTNNEPTRQMKETYSAAVCRTRDPARNPIR